MKVDLLEFYRNEIENNRGATLSDIWNYNDAQLERNHHFIQWLFPTDQPSAFNWSAPVLSQHDIALLKRDKVVMDNFRKSLVFFLRFYGLELHEDDTIVVSIDFHNRSNNWITLNNHNYKRISRILRFLTIFELDDIKSNFKPILIDIYQNNKDVVGAKTYDIWMSL